MDHWESATGTVTAIVVRAFFSDFREFQDSGPKYTGTNRPFRRAAETPLVLRDEWAQAVSKPGLLCG